MRKQNRDRCCPDIKVLTKPVPNIEVVDSSNEKLYTLPLVQDWSDTSSQILTKHNLNGKENSKWLEILLKAASLR